MKSIIIISTIMFVTASFMGIGNYLRYNDSLLQKGLYQTSNEQTTSAEAVIENAETQQPQPRVEDIVIEDQIEEIEQDVPHPEKSAKKESNEPQATGKLTTAKKGKEDVVLHSAKEPTARNIDIKRFSRAALDDDFDPVPIVEIETADSLEASTNNEENE
jgi:hypothetical protein